MAETRENISPDQEAPDELEKDLGFGTAISERAKRLINPDGSINVKRVGTSFRHFHLYNYLISISWKHFWLILIASLIFLNLIFASIYMMIGLDRLMGMTSTSFLSDFAYAFYFSIQTFTTVGYGVISPIGHVANILASIESMMGMIGFAFAAGLLYGRFARPTAKILFSEKALIAPYREGKNALMFRIVNGRQNQLISVQVKMIMSWFPPEGSARKREFALLELERSYVSLFPLSWTIVHPIDEESPLNTLGMDQLMRCDPEFMVVIGAYDDTFSQEVHARGSYKGDECVFGAKFEPMFYVNEEGETVLEVDKLDNWREAKLFD